MTTQHVYTSVDNDAAAIHVSAIRTALEPGENKVFVIGAGVSQSAGGSTSTDAVTGCVANIGYSLYL